VDVWDALIYDRPYRKGLAPSDVKGMITEKSGSHFDPRVVDSFFALGNLLA
jgi:putative two-component system response regulator